MRLSEIVRFADVRVLRDGDFENLGFLTDTQPCSLVFLESERFAAALRRNKDVSAVLSAPAVADLVPEHMALAVCPEPRLTFAVVHNGLAQSGFYWEGFETVIDPTAQVHPMASVAERNVRIACGCSIGPHATIGERCVLGEHVTIGAGAVLGAVGFQTVRTNAQTLEMRHAGGLRVHERVHVLPGAVIATGLFRKNTEISSDARIGSQAFVSHGVHVGERAFVGHGAIVNGGVSIGREAWVGPGAVVAHSLDIGPQAFVSLGAAVIRSVKAGSHVSGNFAVSHRRLLRLLTELDPQAAGR
ncbi:MAG TPA: DapH/DapD/GlmU-related protein [Bryobacteraceae bacterium]|nr:DapH/DapD/GlmU-related protein [Bryobacteraceae bacterium]